MLKTEALSKRDGILTEAAKMFARFGFKKTSIDEIAKEAGVGKGTVYLTADSKEELYYNVVHREVRAWQAACAKAIDPRIPADELLLKLHVEAMRHVENSPLLRDLFRGETRKLLPQWADRFDDLRAIGQMNIAEVIRIGIKQKKFRADLDVEIVSRLLQEFSLLGMILRPTNQTDEEDQRKAMVGIDLVLRGLNAR